MISSLLVKPADLDLHRFQKRVHDFENGVGRAHIALTVANTVPFRAGVQQKGSNLACAPSEDSDQPANPRRVFARRSMGSHDHNDSSYEQRRLRSD